MDDQWFVLVGVGVGDGYLPETTHYRFQVLKKTFPYYKKEVCEKRKRKEERKKKG